MARILVCDDERSMRELLQILLEREGHEVVLESDGQSACHRGTEEEFDLVISDLRIGRDSGITVLQSVKAARPQTEVIIITAFATAENAVQAMKKGAYDYVLKPFKVDELLVVVAKALEKRALVKENDSLKRRLEERTRLSGMLGKGPAMRELFTLIEKVAPSRTTVLVTGESGVGKELVARAIHEGSPRASMPFIAINCGAIPEGLLESELFGHEKGAFTGASHAKEGLFLAAHGGTLLLDEIGELPLQTQVKLLRVLQQRSIRPVGGTRDVEVDVRIVAATNRNLAEEVKEGRFREDLFYRLNVIGLKVPPLRERKDDVLLLANHFLALFCNEMGREGLRFSRSAQAALLDYDYPGNVRELENLVERAVTLAEGETIEVGDFPAGVREGSGQVASVIPSYEEVEIPSDFDLQQWLDERERQVLERALSQAGGVKTEAARLLGISFRSLRYRLEKLQLEVGEGV